MAAPVPNQIWTEQFAQSVAWPKVLSPPSPLKVNDLVVLCIGHEESVGELVVTVGGVTLTKAFETPGAPTQARSAVFYGIAKMGPLSLEIDGDGPFNSQDILIQGFTFRGDYNSSTPLEVFANADSALASVTTQTTGTTASTTTSNALCIAMLNVLAATGGQTYSINNSFGTIVTIVEPTNRQHLSTAQLVLAATQTVQADWSWAVADVASAGVIVLGEATPSLDASAELIEAVTMTLGTQVPTAQIPFVNPASLAAKANLANTVQFNWGRGNELVCNDNVRGYTDWTSDVGIGPNTFIALPSMAIANFRIHGGTQATPVKIKMPVDMAPMDTLARAFPHAPVRVRIGQVDPDNPNETFRELFVGEVTRVSRARGGRARIVQIDVSSYKERLNFPLGIVADTTCIWNFGDKNCCIPLGPLPVIDEPLRRAIISYHGGAASQASSVVFDEQSEVLDNIQLFNGDGIVIQTQSFWAPFTEGPNKVVVDQETALYLVVADGQTPEFPELAMYTVLTGKRLWTRNVNGGDYKAGLFLPGTDDFFATRTFGFLDRRDKNTGIDSYSVQVDGLSSSFDFIGAMAFDGTDLFCAVWDATNGAPMMKRVDISDGSLIEDYDDPLLTDNPTMNAIIVDGTDIYIGGEDITFDGSDKNVFKWTKGVTGAVDWAVQVGVINSDVDGMALHAGSLWVVGPVDSAPTPDDNLFELNPATGAILNQYSVGDFTSPGSILDIKIDAATGDMYLLRNDTLRTITIRNVSDPTTDVAVWVGNRGTGDLPSSLDLIPFEIGLRLVRTIDQVNGSNITFTSALVDPNGTGTRYQRGFVELDDIRVMIRSQVDLTTVQLNRAPPPEWVQGTLVSITPGCDKTIETCRAEWDNEIKFAGPGYGIPRYHPVFETS